MRPLTRLVLSAVVGAAVLGCITKPTALAQQVLGNQYSPKERLQGEWNRVQKTKPGALLTRDSLSGPLPRGLASFSLNSDRRFDPLAHLVGFEQIELPLDPKALDPKAKAIKNGAEKLVVYYPPDYKALVGPFYSRYRWHSRDSAWVPVELGLPIARGKALLALVGTATAGSIVVRRGSELIVQSVDQGQLQGQFERLRLPKRLLRQEAEGQPLELLSLENGVGITGLPELPAAKLELPLNAAELKQSLRTKSLKLTPLADGRDLMAEARSLRGALATPSLPNPRSAIGLPRAEFDLSQLESHLARVEGQLESTKDSLQPFVAVVKSLELPNVGERSELGGLSGISGISTAHERLQELGTSKDQLMGASPQTANITPEPSALTGLPSRHVGSVLSEGRTAAQNGIPLASGVLGGTRTAIHSKAANVWLFGNGIGLDFNQSPPAVLDKGMLRQLEGSASVCDASGRLLFYTDGQTIYDRRHRPMSNGTGLKGHASSSTAALIAPYPGKPGDYLVFTSGFGGYGSEAATGVSYSVVRFDAIQPWGEVIIRDQTVDVDATERMVAVEHADGESVWLITQGSGTSEFRSFLFTREGKASKPVVSQGNRIASRSSSTIGFLKASTNGQLLALTNLGDWQLELYDFDSKNGVLQFRYDLSQQVRSLPDLEHIRTPYGVEFSPNGEFLFVGCLESGVLHRYRVAAASAEAVASSQEVFEPTDYRGRVGAIQLAPDGRLFFTQFGDKLGRATRLGIVHQPNEAKANIDFPGVELNNGSATYGLPIPYSRYLKQLSGDFRAESFCVDRPTRFHTTSNLTPDHYAWDFGDPSSGDYNQSSEAAPSHTYSQAGNYTVRLELRHADIVEVIEREVRISASPRLELGSDVPLVLGASTLLTAEVQAEQFRWMTGERDDQISVAAPGLYYAAATNGACVCRDSVRVLPVWTSESAGPTQNVPSSTSNTGRPRYLLSELGYGLGQVKNWLARSRLTPSFAPVWVPHSLAQSTLLQTSESSFWRQTTPLFQPSSGSFRWMAGLSWNPF